MAPYFGRFFPHKMEPTKPIQPVKPPKKRLVGPPEFPAFRFILSLRMDDKSTNPRIRRPEEWIDARDVLIVPDGPLSGGRLLSILLCLLQIHYMCIYDFMYYVYVSYILWVDIYIYTLEVQRPI